MKPPNHLTAIGDESINLCFVEQQSVKLCMTVFAFSKFFKQGCINFVLIPLIILKVDSVFQPTVIFELTHKKHQCGTN